MLDDGVSRSYDLGQFKLRKYDVLYSQYGSSTSSRAKGTLLVVLVLDELGTSP